MHPPPNRTIVFVLPWHARPALDLPGAMAAAAAERLAAAGAKVEHIFVLFFYDIFPESESILKGLDVTMHYLATWRDVLAVAKRDGRFDDRTLAEVEQFIADPATWSEAHGGVAKAAG